MGMGGGGGGGFSLYFLCQSDTVQVRPESLICKASKYFQAFSLAGNASCSC